MVVLFLEAETPVLVDKRVSVKETMLPAVFGLMLITSVRLGFKLVERSSCVEA